MFKSDHVINLNVKEKLIEIDIFDTISNKTLLSLRELLFSDVFVLFYIQLTKQILNQKAAKTIH